MIAKTTVRRAMLIGAVILAVVVLPAAYAWFTSSSEVPDDAVTARPAPAATTIEAHEPEATSATPSAERPAPKSRADVIKTKVPLTDLRQENVVLDRPAPDPPPEN